MRNARLNRMQSGISGTGVTEKQAIRQVMNKPGRMPIWCYLGETLESTQMTIIIKAPESATLKQNVSVEILIGIKRQPLVRSFVVPKTICPTVKTVSRISEFANCAKVVHLKT